MHFRVQDQAVLQVQVITNSHKMIPIARARKCGSTTLEASVTDSAIINEPLAAQITLENISIP